MRCEERRSSHTDWEKLPMADSLIYATGILEQAVIWTQDEDFQGLENVKFKAKS